MFHPLAIDLIEGYVSVSSRCSRQVMRVLTIITTLFTPLSSPTWGVGRIRVWVALAGLAMVLVVAALGSKALAQESPHASAQQIEARLELVSTNTELSAEVVEGATANYRAALERLTAAGESRAAADALTATAQGAQDRLAEITRRRDALVAELARVEAGAASISPDEASNQLVVINADQVQLRERQDALERQVAGRLTRPAQLRDEIASAASRVTELNLQLDTLSEASSEPELSQLTLLRARLEATIAERDRLQIALATLPPRLELAEAELQLLKAQRSINDRRTTVLAAKVAEERESKSALAARDALALREQASLVAPPLDADVREVAALFDEKARTLAAITGATDTLAQERATREQLAQEYESIRSRVQVAGAQAALGQLLRSQRLRIPDRRELRRAIAAQRENVAAAGLRNLELVDLRREHEQWLSTVLGRAQQAGIGESPGADEGLDLAAPPPVNAAPESTSQAGGGEGQALLVAVAEQRYAVLGELISAYDQYVTLLADSAFEKRTLETLVDEYGSYLDDRLLWVPSAEPWAVRDALGVANAVAWVLSTDAWRDAIAGLYGELSNNAVLYGLGALVFLLLLRIRRHLLGLIDDIAPKTRKVRTDRATYTIEALVYSAFAASVWPSLLVGLGMRWQYLALPEQARAVTAVMPGIGYTLAIAGFVMLLSAPNGVGTLHLQWSETRRRIWPRAFLLLQTLWLPLFAIASVTDAQSHTYVQSSLGRLAFAASCAVLAYLFAMILHPSKGLPANALKAHPEGWASRLRRVWYPLAIVVPVVLAVEALAGYGYASQLLTRCVLETVLLFFAGMLVFDLLERWLRVTRRRFRYEQILERRAASAEASTSEDGGEGTAEREVAVDPEEIDIGEFDDQTRRLMSTIVIILLVFGCWFIWSKALPVLGVLDRLALWSQTGEDGQPLVDVITAADGLIALLTVFLVALATRNLPSLLEFAVLKNLPLDAGSRYAIRSVSQYLLVGAGVMLVAAELGVAWTKVQWLVAALSVGLGFGLQEIFANFVSGLIILLERPVRVGDTVTVGEVSGTVTRIRIRATTITDFDNKEVIVPNKTFITGQLVNWTLTTEMTRVVVPVGVAYGSDLEAAMKAMMDAAKSSPLVLEDPPPRVLFKAFGASSLDFDVYLYCRVLGDRLAARHEVLLTMERALGAAGIEIPFPQRDVHLHHVNAPPHPAPSPSPRPSASAASTLDPSAS